ncbi:MAG: extracellular solute-binding protein [Lachnospiraceae bacterium]|nr:extracellular solute-binding protein [Lachnospiraceae bacterium]
MLSEVATSGKEAEYLSGELSYDCEETRRALENVKTLYDNEYMYPGEGAVTAKNDEIKAAFYQGKLLMMPEIAAGAKVTASEADFEVVAIPWPSSNTKAAVLGSFNGFFIPSNCANPDAAVEVLKAFTEADIQGIHASEGYIPANVNVEVEDEFVKSVVEQSAALNTNEPFTIAINDYRVNQLMADLILNGGVEVAVEGLEAARLAE